MKLKFPNAQIVGPSTRGEITQFLQEWKPSAQREVPDQAQGWIWCHLARATRGTGKEAEIEKPAEDREDVSEGFEKEGKKLVDDLIELCTEIEMIRPERARNYENTAQAYRERAFDDFRQEVEYLARRYGVLSGKWLFFPGPESVDLVWSKVVKALADANGALARTGIVDTAKVSSTATDGKTQVYTNDSWDKPAVGKALKCLVQELQLEPSAYKCDAFTLLGIDSKNQTGIKSSLYSKWDFMNRKQMRAALAAKEQEFGEQQNPTDEATEQNLGRGVKKGTHRYGDEAGHQDCDVAWESETEELPRKRRKANQK